jgi:hypothetical protein
MSRYTTALAVPLHGGYLAYKELSTAVPDSAEVQTTL